jgi:hypothetical protein
MTARQTRTLMVAMIASSAPLLLLLDLVARRLVLAEQPEELRQFLGEWLTRFAWYVVPCPALGGVAGFLLYPRIYRRHLARSTSADREKARHEADLMALMFSASMPQIPALLGDLSLILGAELTPVLCSASISTAAVLLIALVAPRFRGDEGEVVS